MTPGPYCSSLQPVEPLTSVQQRRRHGAWAPRGRARRGKEVLRGADADGVVRDQQSGREEGTATQRPGAAEAAPISGVTHDPRGRDPDTLATCPPPPLGCKTRPRAASRTRHAAALRGRARRKVRVGPGLGVTHRRPGRYIAGWPREPSGAGEIRKAGNRGAAPRAGAQAGREALKEEAGRRRGGTQQGRRGPLSAPGLPAGPPSRGPTRCNLAPKPLSPIGGLVPAPLPEAPPRRPVSPLHMM